MSTLRILPADEYGRLKDVADGICPDPKITRVLVAEQDGQIVGRTMLMAPTHIEGTWVREDQRGGFLGKRLLDGIEAEAKKTGISRLFAYAADVMVAHYLRRLGYQPVEVTVFYKDI